MKKLLLALSFFLFFGCNHTTVRQIFYKSSDTSHLAEITMKPIVDQGLFQTDITGVEIVVQNKTDDVLEIIWNDSSIVGNDKTSPILVDVNPFQLIIANSMQPNAAIAPKETATFKLHPSINYVYSTGGFYYYNPRYEALCPTKENPCEITLLLKLASGNEKKFAVIKAVYTEVPSNK